TLTIRRPGQTAPLSFTLNRQEILTRSVSWTILPGTSIGYIRISNFDANADKLLKDAVRSATNGGAQGLIMDVRNDPGGLLTTAVNVTSEFLDGGTVLIEEDANGKQKNYDVVPGGIATSIPVTVLVNRGTASAAEIFAGALQDHKRAVV